MTINKQYFYEYIRDINYKRSWINKNLTTLRSRVLAQLYKKDFAKIFAEEFGFKVAETYLDGVSLEEAITWISKTNNKSFFLKPLGGRGNRGCYPLQKKNNKLNILGESGDFSFNELYNVAKNVLKKNNYKNQWLIEELVISDNTPGKVGEDIKFYMFYGKIGLILQRGMNFSLLKEERVFKWYDANQKSIDVGKYVDILDETLNLDLSQKIISDVEMLSKKIPYPFFRIDYLIGNGGKLYLNEFTPGPGDPEGFNEVTSKELALLFYNAQKELENDIESDIFSSYDLSYYNILNKNSNLIGLRKSIPDENSTLNDFEIIKFSDVDVVIDSYRNSGFTPRGRKLPKFNINPPVEWALDPFKDRNWMFQLHSLRMLDPWFNKLNDLPFERDREINFIHKVMKDWSRQNFDINSNSSYAWYDMSVGLRALKISFFVNYLRKFEYEFDQDFYYKLAKKHVENLTNIDNLNKGNHGLFQIHGLMSLLWAYPSLGEYKNSIIFAKNQMVALITSQLGKYGVHTENSPDYHFFAIKKIDNIINAPWWKKIDSKEIASKLKLAKIACDWLVDPMGRCAPIGDSTSGTQLIKKFDNLFLWDHKKNGNCIGAILDGYAIVRTEPNIIVDSSSYLFFTAAFHSQTHKHSDCMSFIWQEDNQNILIDSGKFGYKGGAVREYFLSSRAHNTIEINGLSSFRTNEYAYGTGLKKLLSLPQGGWLIHAETLGIHNDIKHSRHIIYFPKEYLLVVDYIEKSHIENCEITNWWHFDERFKLDVNGDSTFVATDKEGQMILGNICSNFPGKITKYYGETEPRLQGWVSSGYLEKKPAPVLGVNKNFIGNQYVSCTLFEYGEKKIDMELFYSEKVKDWVVLCRDLNGNIESIFHVFNNKYFSLLEN